MCFRFVGGPCIRFLCWILIRIILPVHTSNSFLFYVLKLYRLYRWTYVADFFLRDSIKKGKKTPSITNTKIIAIQKWEKKCRLSNKWNSFFQIKSINLNMWTSYCETKQRQTNLAKIAYLKPIRVHFSSWRNWNNLSKTFINIYYLWWALKERKLTISHAHAKIPIQLNGSYV